MKKNYLKSQIKSTKKQLSITTHDKNLRIDLELIKPSTDGIIIVLEKFKEFEIIYIHRNIINQTNSRNQEH